MNIITVLEEQYTTTFMKIKITFELLNRIIYSNESGSTTFTFHLISLKCGSFMLKTLLEIPGMCGKLFSKKRILIRVISLYRAFLLRLTFTWYLQPNYPNLG